MSFDDVHPGTDSPGAEEVDPGKAADGDKATGRQEKAKAREGGAPAPEPDDSSAPRPDTPVPGEKYD